MWASRDQQNVHGSTRRFRITEVHKTICIPAVLSRKASGISLATAARVLKPLQCMGDTMAGPRRFSSSIVLSLFSSGIPGNPK